ncbi:hypothetical protein M3147_10615 [Agromyces mediolanus]|uniref:hypothetical protein n=1 Tax=Agromyces mediolanus TaxID=41986 RepID=UPI00203E96AA|nr:hypothetical protein [Agromyces mediolanus]MCM3657703.1 hypothetical protein [Agromyces mediolanus]
MRAEVGGGIETAADPLAEIALRSTRALRRVFVMGIALAFGIVFARLLSVEGRGLGFDASGHGLGGWDTPDAAVMPLAALGAMAVAMLLLVVSASEERLAAVMRFGLPGFDDRARAIANGMVWAGIALLAVHFAAPAFEWMPGGHKAAGVLLGTVLGAGTARLHHQAISHEAYRTFNLVSMLLAAGSLGAMSITPTGEWWTLNFSTLGTSDDLAAASFNVGIVIAGLGMAVLGPALTRALGEARFAVRRGGLGAARALIAVIGASLAGVGLVPIDTDTLLHNVFACAAAAGFAGLAGCVRLFAKRMPRTLVVLSYAFLALEIAAMFAYQVIGLFNLTVFEIVAFTLVFAWLIALVATTHAHPQAEPSDVGVVTGAVSARAHAVHRRRIAPAGSAALTRPAGRDEEARLRGPGSHGSDRLRRLGLRGTDAAADDPPDHAALV